jgi:RNA polymerase sigma-70 factor (ECF subfamily)
LDVTCHTVDTRVLVSRAVARARGGDAGALHFLYVRYVDDVQCCVQSIVADSDEAEGITRNVFAKLRGAVARYDERDAPFSAWILRIARDAALDHGPRSKETTA